jgi:hypothetical protein
VQKGALHFFGRAEETLAGAGELGPRRAAVEQFCAKRRFERSDAAADGRVIEF